MVKKIFNAIKKQWKYSRLRFYMKNTYWNYRFWFFCKKQYKNIKYRDTDAFSMETKNVTKRRFAGYLYQGKLYLDNPGILGIERDVWQVWKKKGLI